MKFFLYQYLYSPPVRTQPAPSPDPVIFTAKFPQNRAAARFHLFAPSAPSAPTVLLF